MEIDGMGSEFEESQDPRVILDAVYGEIRRLAHRAMAGESRPATLQTTALVHEAWLRLQSEGKATWHNRAQFFVAAARAMRRILVDRARARGRLKRGGAQRRVPLETAELELTDGASSPALEPEDWLALDSALADLRGFNERLARIVELRIFAGMTETETASVLDLSPRSVRREWRAARLWLFERIQATDADADPADVA